MATIPPSREMIRSIMGPKVGHASACGQLHRKAHAIFRAHKVGRLVGLKSQGAKPLGSAPPFRRRIFSRAT
jgi:hypothetical protein